MKIVVPSRRGAEVEMIPLIDTFFLLLAFFISSVLSMSVLKGLPIELPLARAAERLKPEELRVVTVAPDGTVQLDDMTVTLQGMAAQLRAQATPALRVAVRADRALPTGRLVEVLSAVRGAGVQRAGLVTDSAEEE
jgi:biopolymer transport protein ExbD